jgi:hypothetical protein
VVVFNESLNKVFFWGSNKQGQIEIFKKKQSYPKPRAVSFGSHIKMFRIMARGDATVFLCDEDIAEKDLEMVQVPKEDVLGIIHELGSKHNKRSIICGIGE